VVERLRPGTLIVGARFRPGAAPAVLDVPALELRDLQLALDVLWGGEAQSLSERVAEAETIPQKLALIQAAIRARVSTEARLDSLVLEVVASLEQDLHSPVEKILKVTGLSERQLRRRFRLAAGYGPKTFQRIARLRRLRELARSPKTQPISLASLAYQVGYADQAHMTREVTTLAGISPSMLMAYAGQIQTTSDPFTS
jgi:AraC-like DNA-binding protein